MLFMMCCILVMVAACYQMTSTLSAQLAHSANETSPKPSIAPTLLAVAMTLCFTAPLLSIFFGVLQTGPVASVSTGGIRLTVYGVLLGSVLVAVYAYLLFRLTPKAERGHFWPVGRTVILVGVVIVGAASSVSHLSFFHSSKDGIANIEFLRESASLKDMADCKSGVAFVQFRDDDGPLKFRCPTLLMFGGHTSQPFTPWPDYVDGESQELAVVVKDMFQEAKSFDDLK